MLLPLLNCSKEEERKIQLAARPIEALAQERVETIQIAAEEKKKVAILDFDNATRKSDLAWLSQGLGEMLALDLAQSRQLNLLTSRNIEEALQKIGLRPSDIRNADNAQLLADALQAEAVIRGQYFFQRDSLRIQFELRDGVSGEVLCTHVGSSPDLDLENIFSMIDEVSQDFRGELIEKIRDVEHVDRSLAEVTTTSFEAYKHYTQAIENMRSFYFENARDHLERAIKLDTTFASAYYRLGYIVSMGSPENAKPYLKKALRYAEDLPDRERLPIQAAYARIQGNYYKAVELYENYVSLYPEDDNAHYELGAFYFTSAYNYEKAIENFETAVLLNPQHKNAYNMLAYSYAYIGKMDHAYNALDKYVALAETEPNPHDSYGELLQRAGRIEEAIKKYEYALDLNPNFYHSKLHLVSAYRDLGKLSKARKLLKTIFNQTELDYVKLDAASLLVLTELYAGDVKKSKEYLETVYQLHQLREKEPRVIRAINYFLFLEPQSQQARDRFLQAVEFYKQHPAMLSSYPVAIFLVASTALDYNLGLDAVEELLDALIDMRGDPTLFQYALSMKLILDFSKGEDTQETEDLFRQSIEPSVFQYAAPSSWNLYWKHYFNSLKMAYANGEDIRSWTQGFANFAAQANNHHYELSSKVALAATEFITGSPDTARSSMQQLGIPCEQNWQFIGPFDMKRGFHEAFWPEEGYVGEWLSEARDDDLIIQQRDDLFDAYVNLKGLVDPYQNQAIYALLQINSPTVKKMLVHFGINGKLKAWLNDEQVMSINEREHAYIDRYTKNVRLRPGANWLLLRLSDGFDELGFYFRITDEADNPDPSIQFGPTVSITQEELDTTLETTEGA